MFGALEASEESRRERDCNVCVSDSTLLFLSAKKWHRAYFYAPLWITEIKSGPGASGYVSHIYMYVSVYVCRQ